MNTNDFIHHAVPGILYTPSLASQVRRGVQLKRFVSYGTRASAIYKDGCDAFGWKRDCSGYFEAQQPLHATFATPEGYSVWFICHNDLCENEVTFSKRERWNFIHENEIVEVDNDAREAGIKPYPDEECRLVFAKNRKGAYVYYGMFKCKAFSVDEKTGALTRVFVREPDYDVYPLVKT